MKNENKHTLRQNHFYLSKPTLKPCKAKCIRTDQIDQKKATFNKIVENCMLKKAFKTVENGI